MVAQLRWALGDPGVRQTPVYIGRARARRGGEPIERERGQEGSGGYTDGDGCVARLAGSTGP